MEIWLPEKGENQLFFVSLKDIDHSQSYGKFKVNTYQLYNSMWRIWNEINVPKINLQRQQFITRRARCQGVGGGQTNEQNEGMTSLTYLPTPTSISNHLLAFSLRKNAVYGNKLSKRENDREMLFSRPLRRLPIDQLPQWNYGLKRGLFVSTFCPLKIGFHKYPG